MTGRLIDGGALATALAALAGVGGVPAGPAPPVPTPPVPAPAVSAPAASALTVPTRTAPRLTVPTIEAVPVLLRRVAPGVKLTVHVFPAPRRAHRTPVSRDACADTNTQTAYALFARGRAAGMTFDISNRYAPRSVWATAEGALLGSLTSWNSALGWSYFSARRNDNAPTRTARDGVNAVGWAQLRPTGTLATTWTYTDAGNRVLEADVFFNTASGWGVLSGCNSAAAFDLENVATHEFGHVLGLDHVGDLSRQATMYPTSPSGEVRKRTLTPGDRAGAAASLR